VTLTSPSLDFGRGRNYRVGAAEGAGTYGAREELFSDDEALAPTEHEKILVVSNGAEPPLGQWKADVEALLSLARAGETEKARERLRAIVCPPNSDEPELKEIYHEGHEGTQRKKNG